MTKKAEKKILINCDLGEGMGNDAEIMPWIDAVNIACGYHAGDTDTMWRIAELAKKNNVTIGAHPSFPDQDNFGRTEMNFDPDDIYDLVTQQLIVLNKIVTSQEMELYHVKPHGALYNMSARDTQIAGSIAKAVFDFDPSLILVGLSGSHSITESEKAGLKTASETFADRSYQDDGSLTTRSSANALIEDVDKVINQVRQMIETGTVNALSGKTILVKADTICIHGDGKYAVEFAKAIHKAIYK
ncbi:MAG TPA: 5-oxoprolinase subunit PxpA [Chitinophagaceae bacterium]|nr:5-oxoprolinase subunit PxpA [Chitinophagaceae bacterium]